MAKPNITAENLRAHVRYEPETGEFIRLIPGKGKKVGENMATGKHYKRVNLLGRGYAAHHLAFLYMTGSLPVDQVDHKNGDGSDNRWSNLRQCTQSQNQHNRAINRNNKTGLPGVTTTKNGTYAASYRAKYIGAFNTKEEAYAAYLLKRKEAGFHELPRLDSTKYPMKSHIDYRHSPID